MGDADSTDPLEASTALFQGLLDPDGRLTNINARFAALVKEGRGELIGQRFVEAFDWSDEEDRSALNEAIKRARSGHNAHLQTTLRTREARARSISLTLHPVTNDAGAVVYIVVTGHDSTESDRTFDRLASSIMDSTPSALFVIDDTGRIAWMNRSAETYFDLTRSAVLGCRQQDFLQDSLSVILDQPADFTEQVERAYDQGVPISDQECRVGATDFRKERTLQYSSHAIQDGPYRGGRVEYYQDITALKETQQQLESALLEKKTLLKEIHHRVKNNLQTINSLLSLQSREFDSPRLTRAFQDSQDRIRAMAMVHEQLYDAESLSQVNVSDYLKKIVQQLESTHGSSAKLTYDIDAPDLSLSMAVRCGLIVSELISNAYEHTPDGSAVSVQFSVSDGTAHLSVGNDGPGVDEIEEGTGFGIVRSLVEYELDGTVTINSSDGFCVDITFPFDD